MHIRTKSLFSLFFGVLALSFLSRAAEADAPNSVSFIREVAPILVANCQSCHGEKTAESSYRLDTFDMLMREGDFGVAPVTADNLDESELHRLITSEDEDERMPNNGDQLSDAEVSSIKNWILQGAKFDGADPASPLQGQIPRTAHPPAPATYPSPIPVTATAFTGDGAKLLVGGYHEIMIWDHATETLAARISDIPERVFDLQFSPDNTQLAVAGGAPGVSGEVQLIPWDNGPQPDVPAKILATHTDMFFAVAFRPDGKQLAATCSDGSVRLFDVATGKQVLKIANHSDWVTDVAFSSDGKRVATCSRDKTAKAFDAETGQLLATYSGHDAPVRSVVFTPDATMVISAAGNLARVWKIEDSKPVGDMGGFGGEVYAIETDGESIIAAATDRTAREFKIADRKQVRSLADHPNWILSLDWHQASKRLSTGCFDGSITIWNLEEGVMLKRFVAIPPEASPTN